MDAEAAARRCSPGLRLGPFEILGPLGSGGMGEVYRARDTRLDRTVALKVLPAALVRDKARVARLVREAKAASALSHPHAVTVHEIGEAVPVGSGGEVAEGGPRHYIAMELVAGRTLREILADGAEPLEAVVGWLAQAAEGIAVAHEAGIVHRDLKPENLMVTRDGFAKVLDFGLAKLTEPPEDAAARAAESPRRGWRRSPRTAPSSAPWATCRRSRSRACPSTPAPTSSAWGASSMKRRAGGGPSRARPRSTCSTRSCAAARARSRSSPRGCRAPSSA